MAVGGIIRTSVLGSLVAAALAVVGSVPAAAQQNVKVLLDWRFEGPAAPFLVAADRGYYKTEGLDATLEPGNGSIEPIAKVAAGAFDIGFGDINALIRYRDQNPNAPVTAIFMVYNKPPYSITGRRSRGVVQPKDLEGKRLGAPTGDASYAVWPLFARLAGIDASKVTVVNVGFPVRDPMLASGEVDAITGFGFSTAISLKDRGVPPDDITMLLMANHGLDLYGSAVLVNTKFAAEKPEAVRGFLRAFTRGLQDTIRRPANAVDAVLKRNELAKRDVELERLQTALRVNVLTPEVKANGLGAVDPARLSLSIDQLGLAYAYKNGKPKAEEVFDASFLPPASARQTN